MRILRAPALMGGWYRPQRRILRIAIWHHCASLGVHWQLFAYKATRWLRGGGGGRVLCHYLELQGKSHPIFAGKVESLMKVYIVCLLGCLRVISKCLGTELLEPRLALR